VKRVMINKEGEWKMKKKMCIVVVLALASCANAAWMVVDDFEGYADSAELQAAWVPNTGSLITSETLETFLNGECMLITNATQASPYYVQTKLTLPGVEMGVHGVNLTYQGFTGIQMTFAVPPNSASTPPYGGLGGSGGDTFISMYDCWGGKVWSASYTGDVTPSNTGYPNGIVWENLFSTGLEPGQNFENVAQITIGYDKAYYGAGCLLVDDVILTPEPATIALFGLGAIGLLRRSKK
jgi:hypothetical protein